MHAPGLTDNCRKDNEKKSMDAIAERAHLLRMNSAVRSSVEKGKPAGLSEGALLLIQMLFAVALGWLGLNWLLDAMRDNRERDATTVQGILDARPQDEDHRPVTPAAVKAVTSPVPISAAKPKGSVNTPAAKPLAERPGRRDAKAGEQIPK
jgi:hypothetical protein